MADKPTDDPTFINKQKQTQKRKQRGGLAAAFVAASLLVPSGWFVADRYVYGTDNFEHAVTQTDYDSAQTYVARLGDEDMARFFRHAATTGDMTLFNMLLAQDDDNSYGYGVVHIIKDDIVTLAAQNGHDEIIERMAHSGSYISPSGVFMELSQHGHGQAAIRMFHALGVDEVHISNAIDGAIQGQHYEAAAELLTGLPSTSYVSRQPVQIDRVLRGLASSGRVPQAIDLATHFNQREQGVTTIMRQLATQGQTQALLDLAYGEGLSSQYMLNSIYVAALLGQQDETANALEANFHIDKESAYVAALESAVLRDSYEAVRFLGERFEYEWDYYDNAIAVAMSSENVQSSAQLVNDMLEKFPEETAAMILSVFERPRFMFTKSRFAFDLVQQINMPDAIKSRVANSFGGTMDDALRTLWGIQDTQGAEHPAQVTHSGGAAPALAP